MNIHRLILSKLEEAWHDASLGWQDEIAAQYRQAVIDELILTIADLEKRFAALEENCAHITATIATLEQNSS